MRALRVHKLGEPRDVLTLEDVPTPEAGAGQLLVRVRAAAVNFPDVLLCRGLYQIKPPLPFTPGVELCGEVVAVGSDTTGFAVGDRIIGTPTLPVGTFAEFTVVDADKAFPAPPSLDDAQAASLHIGHQTAWFALHRRAALQAGETLLVHAAAGGVGSAAVQLGKAAGARVIAVVGGSAKAEVARSLGADLVVDRHTEDFVEAVKAFTDGRGADVVFDPVGGDAYRRSTKCIAFEGRIVVLGFAGGEIQSVPLSHALIKNYSILGLHWGLYATYNPGAIAECHRHLTDMAEAGVVAPLVSERLPLEALADGVQRLADGTTVGRLVYTPGA
jgi:NADPH:quinone reductase and related Zn-dependent oxidoreductases